jgi:hypothetical protein
MQIPGWMEFWKGQVANKPLFRFVVRVEDGVCSMRYLIIDVALAATMTSLFIVALAAVVP